MYFNLLIRHHSSCTYITSSELEREMFSIIHCSSETIIHLLFSLTLKKLVCVELKIKQSMPEETQYITPLFTCQGWFVGVG